MVRISGYEKAYGHRKGPDLQDQARSIAGAILFVLGYSRFLVEDRFGRGWAVCMAVVAAAAWFGIRPWQFGLMPDWARREAKLGGALFLCGFALLALADYWRYGRN